MDINDIRDPQIHFFGLKGTDNIYTFYHDETNNIRKLHIDDQGLNIPELKIFVLGGIVHEGNVRSIDIEPLRKALRIQKSTREIKLKHIAKGEFLDLLNSPSLTIFLKWVSDNGFLIHYHSLDPLYWSIVDIIDSILPFSKDAAFLMSHSALLKNDLNEILRNDLSATINLFRKYDYPGLTSESCHPFLDELIELVETHAEILLPFNANMLKGVLAVGKELDALEFIEGFPPYQLINSFSDFYRNRIAIFKYANHILDIETTIRDSFLSTPLTNRGKPFINYRFADSTTEEGIQISDVIVGLLGKMHTYFSETSTDQVEKDRCILKTNSLLNAEILRDLIDASHKKNIAFLHHVGSQSDINKLDIFLHLEGSNYSLS